LKTVLAFALQFRDSAVMGKNRTWLVALLAVVLGGMAWFALSKREPLYQGKPLSFWLWGSSGATSIYFDGPSDGPLRAPGVYLCRERFTSGSFPGTGMPFTDTGQQAIQEAGTNTIPMLLRLLRAKDSDLKLKLLKLAGKQHFFKINFIPADVLNYRARKVFVMLGPQASNAVPALAGICDENISPSSRLEALDSLGWIGPAASRGIPALLRGANSTNVEERIASLWSLGMIHAQPGLVVPVLFKSMQDPDTSVRAQAVYALSAYGPEAKAAVEPFMPMIRDLDPYVRHFITLALLDIAPELVAKLPEAGQMVRSWVEVLSDERSREEKRNEWRCRTMVNLGNLHIMPELVVPALIRSLKINNLEVRRAAASALAKFGGDATPAVPTLLQVFNNTNSLPIKTTVASALLAIDPKAAAK